MSLNCRIALAAGAIGAGACGAAGASQPTLATSVFENPCPTFCTCDLRGDANGDCQVNVDDLLAVINAWGTHCGRPGYNPCADLDRDCLIGQSDLDIVIADWGNHC